VEAPSVRDLVYQVEPAAALVQAGAFPPVRQPRPAVVADLDPDAAAAADADGHLDGVRSVLYRVGDEFAREQFAVARGRMAG
jgi:hypothetical protein